MPVDPKSVSHTLRKVGEIDGIQRIEPVETKGEFVNGRMTTGIPVMVVKLNTLHRMEQRRK